MSGWMAWAGVAAAMVLGTQFVGWWTVPVLGLLAGAASAERGTWWRAALAAAVAWGVLLLALLPYPVRTLATRLAGAMQLPVPVLLLATLLLPALMAGAAAALATAVRRGSRAETVGAEP